MIITTHQAYDYNRLSADITSLKSFYPFLKVCSIGQSILGRTLYCLRLGNGKNQLFYNGAHHGMEWITSLLLMRFAEDYLSAYHCGGCIGNKKAAALWKSVTLYIVPMVNPDGVEFSIHYPEKYPKWQANAHGVDLNHNYAALWNKSKSLEIENGITKPGPTRFGGEYPESEPESRAVAEFTRKHDFKMAFAFHSQGQVIYYSFEDCEPLYAYSIGSVFEKISPYTLDNTVGIASYAGYKDWFIHTYNRPAYTVEVGLGENPLPIEQFPQIYKDTLPILSGAINLCRKL